MATTAVQKIVFVVALVVVVVILLTATQLFVKKGNYRWDLATDGSTHGEPMILSLNYWEQTANALRNLADLQCWASEMNINKIVEPAIYSSPGNVFQFSDIPEVAFTDYFDITLWNSLNRAHNHSTLVPISNFWEASCKDVAFVQLLMGKKPKCHTLSQLSTQSWYIELASRGFRIRSICIHFNSSMNDKVFRNTISSLLSRPASILFNEWRGINGKVTFRLPLKLSKCHDTFSRIMKLAEGEYPLLYSRNLQMIRDKFLSTYMRGSKYVAVMIRTEKIDESITGFSKLNKSPCIKCIINDRNKGLELTGTTKTLFFTDFGEHGSSSFMYKVGKRKLSSAFSRYLETTLNPFYSSQELNNRLESVSGSNDSVLIAILHSMLAAYAEAIVLVGGGSFQAQTLQFHTQFYRQHSNAFRRDAQCKSYT